MAAQHLPWISPDEFLDLEIASETKHTYYAGVITAMAGGSVPHAQLAMKLGAELLTAVRGRGCRVVGSDVMFQTGSQELLTYPDLMVICGPVATMPGRPTVITNPLLVAEVLSPSTEAKDRGDKAREYRASPTIQQYLLLSQDRPLVEIHTRHEDGTWRISEASGLEAFCELTSLDCRIPLASLYDGVLEA